MVDLLLQGISSFHCGVTIEEFAGVAVDMLAAYRS